ncbi:hypothetical protein JG688_00014243 [Phytophthora aleatoria]|uniref:MULE transposase domain-containing protein n=1 Tax=Phytophthora aleatoria TaxID=2496075 RepID=A0A8J5IG80_9STRA|nr:hypothetical protein JG688_00014243 [Phytophthora aleatoria]
MFPDTRVLLCQFHVLMWLRGAVRGDKKVRHVSHWHIETNVLLRIKHGVFEIRDSTQLS